MSGFREYEWDCLPIIWENQEDDVEAFEKYLAFERFKSAIQSAYHLCQPFGDPDFFEIHGA